ncbi:hypothetical protein GN958_ATG15974, partial [Phytophthora infestans]
YESVLASLGRTGELCESVLVSLGRADELFYGECENICNNLTISTKCHTSTVSSAPNQFLCQPFCAITCMQGCWRLIMLSTNSCIRGAFLLLSGTHFANLATIRLKSNAMTKSTWMKCYLQPNRVAARSVLMRKHLSATLCLTSRSIIIRSSTTDWNVKKGDNATRFSYKHVFKRVLNAMPTSTTVRSIADL